MERAFERLEDLNAKKFEQAKSEAKAEAADGRKGPYNFPYRGKTADPRKSRKLLNSNERALSSAVRAADS